MYWKIYFMMKIKYESIDQYYIKNNSIIENPEISKPEK